MDAEVFAFGQKLADESVGVFVDAALPGAPGSNFGTWITTNPNQRI
jgi:hypothetical protein